MGASLAFADPGGTDPQGCLQETLHEWVSAMLREPEAASKVLSKAHLHMQNMGGEAGQKLIMLEG